MKTPKGPWLLVWIMAATVVALVAALLLTRGDDSVDVDALLAAAPRAVDEQGSALLDMEVEIESPTLDLTVDGTGAVDFATGAGWFTVELLGTTIELRTNGETLFVLPDGDTTWLAVHAEDTAPLGSFGTGPSEAIALVDLLRGTYDGVEDLGTEEIDGSESRHLRLEVDLATAAADAAEDRRPAIEALNTVVPDGVLPLEVWIDERSNLPVRQRMRGEVQGVGVVVTMHLTGWGDELGRQIPPEGAVRDIEPDELTRIFGGPPAG